MDHDLKAALAQTVAAFRERRPCASSTVIASADTEEKVLARIAGNLLNGRISGGTIGKNPSPDTVQVA